VTACYEFNINVSIFNIMHQHPRPSPVTASPASSPRTNPTRTNNPREESSRATPDMTGYNEADEGSGESGVMPSNGPSRDAVKKLDQIIQVRQS